MRKGENLSFRYKKKFNDEKIRFELEELGEIIKDKLFEKKLNYEEIAYIIGCSFVEMSRVINGLSFLNLSLVVKLEIVLGLKKGFILSKYIEILFNNIDYGEFYND